MSGTAEPKEPALFRADALSIYYGSKAALRDVTLRIAARRVTALIGPSGCGKTSFLSSLNRLTDMLPGCRVTGSLRMHDADVLAPDLDVVSHRRRVGMIFQKPNPFAMSIRRNLELPLREHGVRPPELSDICERVLRDVGLWSEVKDRLHASALTLSGGQQQRLCIARALALDPEVLLMDEPCSALDPLSSGVVEDLIQSLGARMTIIVVTHNLAQAQRIAHDAAMFWSTGEHGQLIESAPAEELFNAPQHETTKAYIQGGRAR